ncbi:histidine kinase [Muricomes sp. OA1]|nr:histidine kinase [Muricomes sp. OA1]MRM88444.1 hypothetical protein [Faecalicatena contorta]
MDFVKIKEIFAAESDEDMMQKKAKVKISLKRQLSLWFGMIYAAFWGIVFIVLIVSVLSYHEEKEFQIQEKLEKAEKVISSDIDQITKFVIQLYLREDEIEKMKSVKDGLETYKNVYTIQKNMDLWMNMTPSLDGVFVYYNDGHDVVYEMGMPLTLDEKNQLLQNNQSILMHETKKIGEAVQQLGNRVYYTAYCNSGDVSVFVVTEIGDVLDEMMDQTLWKLTGIEQYGMIFGNSELKDIWKQVGMKATENVKKSHDSYVIYFHHIQEQNMGIFLVLENSLWRYVSSVHILILMLLIISLYPAYRVYHLLQRQILQPLEELTENMRILQTGQWEVDIRENTNLEEIDNVNKTFAVMIQEIKNFKIQAYEEKSQRQQAQMQYLQLQLNPHFYVNCLKLIQAKVGLGDVEHLEDFLVELSYHFRYLMKKSMQLVTVEEEIKFVENYLKVVRELYAGKMKVCIYADREALQMNLPILAIQTFVENTVKYARKECQKELMIQIQVKYMNVGEGEFLIITVKDNGIGYPEEIIPILNSIKDEGQMGIGVFNLKRRIEMLYPKGYSWYFCNQGGASSELVLPCLEKNS